MRAKNLADGSPLFEYSYFLSRVTPVIRVVQMIILPNIIRTIQKQLSVELVLMLQPTYICTPLFADELQIWVLDFRLAEFQK